jgi:pimeloyl-ACP methyl ester carboxylesterase
LVQAADPTTQPFTVKVTGHGQPMILIPGLMCSGAVWDATVEHYKDRYECHVLTLAGFAGQPPISGAFLDTVRKGIADYARAKKLDKPVIIGHSLGGVLVFTLGEQEPDLPGALVAVDGLPCLAALVNEKVDAEGRKKLSEQMRGMLEKPAHDAFVAQGKRMLQSGIADAKARDTVSKWVEDSDQPTAARAMGELFALDLRSDLGRIKAPVLLLGAWSKGMESRGMKRDAVTKRYQDQVAGVPNHKVAIADNANHFIMFDDPAWMFAQIDEFLAKK